MSIVFSESDQNSIQDLIKKRGFSSDVLDFDIERWRQLVDQSRSGYDDDVTEYTNDLASRDFIQSIYEELSDEGKLHLMSVVAPLDNDFKSFTTQIDSPLMAYRHLRPNIHFWYYRVPKRIGNQYLPAFEGQAKESLRNKVEVFAERAD